MWEWRNVGLEHLIKDHNCVRTRTRNLNDPMARAAAMRSYPEPGSPGVKGRPLCLVIVPFTCAKACWPKTLPLRRENRFASCTVHRYAEYCLGKWTLLG